MSFGHAAINSDHSYGKLEEESKVSFSRTGEEQTGDQLNAHSQWVPVLAFSQTAGLAAIHTRIYRRSTEQVKILTCRSPRLSEVCG